jgi:hypothetical protein
MFESPAVDNVLQPILASLNLNWQPNHGVTPFLGAFAFTAIVTAITALKQVLTGMFNLH